jgi:hypothetical protein
MNVSDMRQLRNMSKIEKYYLEAPGFEPGAFRMRSGHSTTELCPQLIFYKVYLFELVFTQIITNVLRKLVFSSQKINQSSEKDFEAPPKGFVTDLLRLPYNRYCQFYLPLPKAFKRTNPKRAKKNSHQCLLCFLKLCYKNCS